MKKHLSQSSKKLLFAILFPVICLLLFLAIFRHKTEEATYHELTNQLFSEEMCNSTLNMHYTIADPAFFGIRDYKAILPLYSKEKTLSSRLDTENFLENLRLLHKNKLPGNDKETLTLLTRYLENNLALCDFPYYEEPFSPSGGMQSQLPILLAEYTFRNSRDVNDYLSLLEQSGNYLLSLLTFEQEKKKAGLLMPDCSIKKVRKQCDTILSQEELYAETHFLQTGFRERLRPLLEQGKITQTEAKQYILKNNRLLRTVMKPAYEQLSDGLLLLEGQNNQLNGLAAYPDGKAYYEKFFISQTGSYRPLSEIKTLLMTTLKQETAAIQDLAGNHPDIAKNLADESYTSLPIQTPGLMLSDLKKRMQKDFPPISQQNKDTENYSATTADNINVTIKEVSQNLEDYTAPAFYLTTPIDATTENVIYINRKNAPNFLELYTTLAHEGYPGHLYQNVYCNRTLLSKSNDPVRSVLWYGGYLEGWAVYVEFMAYDYASDMLTEQNRASDAVCVQLEKHNRSLLLCLYSLMDLMIHYENASLSDIALLLAPFGVTDRAAVESVYTYIVENPCNYPKYYVGYLEFLELKKQALTLWKDSFTPLRFHRFVLDYGPADFTSLEEFLQASS